MNIVSTEPAASIQKKTAYSFLHPDKFPITASGLSQITNPISAIVKLKQSAVYQTVAWIKKAKKKHRVIPLKILIQVKENFSCFQRVSRETATGSD